MNRIPLPEAERRGDAVRLACRILISNQVRLLPPDPLALGQELGFEFRTMTSLAEEQRANPYDYIRHTVGEEAFTLSFGERYVIVYDDTVRSPERIRFSIFHEFGHILLDHFKNWNLKELALDQARVLEDEANTFARNILCPPPILDLIRGKVRDAKWPALFCLSERAWKARVRTVDVDRRYIPQTMADQLRTQFREYMFGRRCRDCGEVFTDELRVNRCPRCGGSCLLWNPEMETREQGRAHRHVAGVMADDLKPRIGENKTLDLTGYWELVKKENKKQAPR